MVFVEVSLVGGLPVIVVVGEVAQRGEGEDVVRTAISAQIAQRPPAVVIDLRQATFMGSAGLRMLVRSHADAEQAGTRLAIVADQCAALCPLAVTRVDGVLHVHRNVFEAIAAAQLGSRPMAWPEDDA
ncbi:STAS domain-containing protein [Lentzea sp. NPDC051208]|uniref:STAS domain-containing protein n=1 Tax=Lentzea sp. NPDC051208 TaxID=3154642 RepID=UPI003440C5D4